jgi:hypothetical protein
MHIPNDRESLDYHRVLCGLPRLGTPGPSAFSYEMLTRTEWSPEFEQLMRNRLVMGAMRYGLLGMPGVLPHHRVIYMEKELLSYLIDRNKERLVDIANMALALFVEDTGPFEPKDDLGHMEIF